MGVRRLLGSPLHRLVLAVACAGAAAQLAVGAAAGDRPALVRLDLPASLATWGDGRGLLAALLLLTAAADLVAVRVRHGDQAEELTLYGAAVVVGVVVVPVGPALLLPVLASVLCSTVRRRGLLKTVFNAGNLAAATAGLVACLQAVAVPGAGLAPRTVLGLVLGSVVFGALNLVGVSRVLAVVTDADPWDVVREGVRLTLMEAVGTVALGGFVVGTAATAPALLPFALAPAFALTFAYRAAAQEAEERQRSEHLLALSQLLAGTGSAEQLLDAFLDLSRRAFGADVALALVDEGELLDEASTARLLTAGGPAREPAPDELAVLSGGGSLALGGHGPVALPSGWVRAVRAPLLADGRQIGVVALATGDRHQMLGDRELALLSSLASALAGALRAATSLRRLVAETAKLKAVVEHSSDGILVLDGAGRVQLWSPAVAALTARTEADALGQRVADLVAALDATGTPVALDAAGTALSPASSTATVELVLLRPDGEQRVVRAAHAGVFDADGTLERDVVIVHDVTRERQVDRLKADFIATVSHELRTPVTPIKGYAEMLLKHGAQMTPAKREHCLGVISDRAEHLARLVEDLLLASRFSATGATPATIDLAEDELGALVRRAGDDFGDESGRVHLELPAHPLPVLCDRVRTIQVLTNLVGNAVKYSAPGTPVLVRARVQAGQVVVEVQDRGRGIPEDQLEKVFEKFHRVEDPLRMTTGGTGLGLYIARQLACAMGGTLSCSSVLGEGSTFRFALPVHVGARPGTGPGRTVAGGVPGLPGLRPPAGCVPPRRAPQEQEPARTLG